MLVRNIGTTIALTQHWKTCILIFSKAAKFFFFLGGKKKLVCFPTAKFQPRDKQRRALIPASCLRTAYMYLAPSASSQTGPITGALETLRLGTES